MLVVFVAAMIALQLARNRVPSAVKATTPGPARGDLAFTADCLQAEYDDWTRIAFSPAPPPESLPEGTVAWTHSWTFQQENLNALVTFDQANFAHWHDLTVCYEGIGWTLEHKSTVAPELPATSASSTADSYKSVAWPYVVARLQKPGNVEALLVFSLFFDDGDPVDARDYDLATSAADGIERMLAGRLETDRRISSVASIRQCQVFVPFSGAITQAQIDLAVELHFQTREAFRTHWLQHWHQSHQN